MPDTTRSQFGQRLAIIRTTARLKREGAFQPGMSREELVAVICAGYMDDAVRDGDPGFDWAGFLAAVEAILPFLILIFGL